MSKRLTILIVAALLALVGVYQFAPTQADDREFDRTNCEVENKCS